MAANVLTQVQEVKLATIFCLFYTFEEKKSPFFYFAAFAKSFLSYIGYIVMYDGEQYICSKLIISLVSPALILCFFFGVFMY